MVHRKRGILAVIASSVAIFWPGAFIFGFPGVMASYWIDLFHVGQGAIGHIMFFVLAAVGIMMFFVGRWQEKLGIRTTVTIGVVATGLDMIVIAFVSDLSMVYAWAFIMGAASCFVYIPAVTTVQRWFPHRRGLVSGIVSLMFGFSGAVISPVLTFLLVSVGYVTMIVILGAIALGLGIVAAQFTDVPERVLGESEVHDTPSAGPALHLEHDLTVRESVRTGSFWFLWATWALQGAAGIAMITLSIAYGLSRGFTLETAVVILTAFNFANGASRLLGGILSDIVGRNFVMSITFLGSAVAYFILPHVANLFVLSLLAAIIGFAFGTLFAVSAPLAVDCFGILHFGAIFGLVFTAYGFVAGPLGPSFSGYILDVTGGNFLLVFSYLGAFCMVSSLLIRFVRPPAAR